MEKNDTPMIEEYRVEAALVHASKTAKHAHILAMCCVVLVLAALICNVLIVNIFTTKYNDRTERWINAYREMVLSLTEGTENENAGKVQQFSPP